MMDEYIKREDVLQHKRKMRCSDFNGGFWDFIVLCEDIERIPAAEVAEVRHGKWIPISTYDTQEHFYRCSACNRYESVMYEYCHCGAKMDGKGEGE